MSTKTTTTSAMLTWAIHLPMTMVDAQCVAREIMEIYASADNGLQVEAISVTPGAKATIVQFRASGPDLDTEALKTWLAEEEPGSVVIVSQ